MKKFDKSSFKSKCSFLVNFFNDLDKFKKLKSKKEETKEKKTNVYDTVSELYNDLLKAYFDEYYGLLDAKRRKTPRPQI